MSDLTRRTILQGAAAAMVTSALPDEANAQPATKPVDRDFVIAAGMTDAEAACWEITAKAAGAFFALPELHPMDRQEVASAIHIIQNKLLSRPTYRKYLENAKAAQGGK